MSAAPAGWTALHATALVVGGTTGEAPTLSDAEHGKLIRIAVGIARHRVPVVAGERHELLGAAVAERLGRPVAFASDCVGEIAAKALGGKEPLAGGEPPRSLAPPPPEKPRPAPARKRKNDDQGSLF